MYSCGSSWRVENLAPRAPFNAGLAGVWPNSDYGEPVLATAAAAQRGHRRRRLFRAGFELAVRKLEHAAREATTGELLEKVEQERAGAGGGRRGWGRRRRAAWGADGRRCGRGRWRASAGGARGSG
jgi:hypothetical protein